MDHTARIEEFFNALRADTMDLCDGFYHSDVAFVDPLGAIDGREALKRYYAKLYAAVREIRFDFGDFVVEGGVVEGGVVEGGVVEGGVERGPTVVGAWDMTLTCGLNGRRPYTVPGVSWIRFDPQTDLAVYHRDVFDVGDFVYERLPLLGTVTRMVKRKMASH